MVFYLNILKHWQHGSAHHTTSRFFMFDPGLITELNVGWNDGRCLVETTAPRKCKVANLLEALGQNDPFRGERLAVVERPRSDAGNTFMKFERDE